MGAGCSAHRQGWKKVGWRRNDGLMAVLQQRDEVRADSRGDGWWAAAGDGRRLRRSSTTLSRGWVGCNGNL